MSTSQRRILHHIVVIAALAAGAEAARLLFSPALGSRVPFLIFTLAVAITAQSVGMVSGLIVTALGILLIDHGAPPSDPYMHTVLAIFGAVGGCLSVFGGLRKRTERRLQRVGCNLDAAQHIAHMGSWESSFDGKLWWSPGTYSIFGVAPGTELRNDDFFALVHPEDLDKVQAAVDEAIRSGNDYDVEHRIVRKSDGEVRHVHQRAKIVANGAIHLVGSIQDVTEARRKAAELERISRVMGLALEATNSGAWMLTVETDELIWTESYRRLMSIDPDVKPSADVVYALVHPHDLDRLKASLQDALAGNVTEFCTEFRVQRGDAVRWMERRGRVYRDAVGRTLLVGITTDVSERKILRGLLPTCSQCKKIRDDDNQWHAFEDFLSEYSEARFSHGLCPECMHEWATDSGLQVTNASGLADRR